MIAIIVLKILLQTIWVCLSETSNARAQCETASVKNQQKYFL